MNMHAITPTQQKLHQAHKERQARLWALNPNVELVRRQDEINRLNAQVAQQRDEIARLSRELALRRNTQLVEDKVRKAAWRRSWAFMCGIAKYVDPDERRSITMILRNEREREVSETLPKRKTCREILLEVAAKYQTTADAIASERRSHEIKQARMEAYYRACTETVLSMVQIGRVIGGRDHTTVLYGKRVYRSWMEAKARGETSIPRFPQAQMHLILDITE